MDVACAHANKLKPGSSPSDTSFACLSGCCAHLFVCVLSSSCVSSSRIGSYKEVQFHGPIEFSRDVEAIVVHSRHKTDKAMMAMVEEFRKNNHCNVVFMEPDDH